jgi:hypothetical protein
MVRRARTQHQVVVVVEGSAPGHLAADCRRAFKELFRKLQIRRHPSDVYPAVPDVIAAGPRRLAYKSFCNLIKHAAPNTTYLLLVDSESPISLGSSKWLHLLNREGDKWIKPDGVGEEHVFLMVQEMESWLIADPDALSIYYGQGFDKNKLPKNKDVEAVDKGQLNEALARATEQTKKGPYSKGSHSFALLALVDAALVEQRCPHAHDLFAHLRLLFEA